MSIAYWYDGAWNAYASARLASRSTAGASFSYIPTTGANAGKTLTASGTPVAFAALAPFGVKTVVPGATYYVRTGTVGPKVFAISDTGEGMRQGYQYTGVPQGEPAPEVIQVLPSEAEVVPARSGLPKVVIIAVAAYVAWRLLRGKK